MKKKGQTSQSDLLKINLLNVYFLSNCNSPFLFLYSQSEIQTVCGDLLICLVSCFIQMPLKQVN